MTPSEYAFMRIMLDEGVKLVFHPAYLILNGTRLYPDFYREDTQEYIEVSGTRQAYHASKDKYAAFRAAYPGLRLKVVKPDGTEISTQKGVRKA